jgi:peptide/nickel transport system permease protein
MYAGRVSLPAAAIAIAVGIVLGVPAGLTAGYHGGRIGTVILRLCDIVLSIPAVIVLLAVLAVFTGNVDAAMVALGVLVSPTYIRLVEASTRAVRKELYIDAARVAGLSPPRIMVRHILPHVAPAVVVQASLVGAIALLTEAGLSFVGLGVAPPTPSWGGMIAEASQAFDEQKFLLLPAGLILTLTVLSLSMLADALRDAYSPTARRSPAVPRGTQRHAARRRKEGADRGRAARPDTPAPSGQRLLVVRGLTIRAVKDRGVALVTSLDLDVYAGETVALVGESGSGKTLTARAILTLLPDGLSLEADRLDFDGHDLLAASPRDLRQLRGAGVAYIGQEPMASLDPNFTVMSQLAEPLRLHQRIGRGKARAQALALLRDVGINDPDRVARSRPYQLSGGMAQRVAIAIALTGNPRLLIADEPTTALDVTVQAAILDLLRELQQRNGMAILLVSHDLGVVADLCDRTVVMYAGEPVEQARTRELLIGPLHPYSASLIAANPASGTIVGGTASAGADSSDEAAGARRYLPMIPGQVPLPRDWPGGCRFAPRCGYAIADCSQQHPLLTEQAGQRSSRCIRVDKLLEKRPA